MSVAGKIKEIEARNVELESNLVAVTKELEDAKVSAAAELKGVKDESEILQQAFDKHKVEATAKQTELEGKLEEGLKVYGELEEKAKADTEELAKAKEALANPAFANAAIVGRTEAIEDGGEAGEEEGGEKKSAWKQYMELRDSNPALATAFWNENQEALKAEQVEAAKTGKAEKE